MVIEFTQPIYIQPCRLCSDTIARASVGGCAVFGWSGSVLRGVLAERLFVVDESDLDSIETFAKISKTLFRAITFCGDRQAACGLPSSTTLTTVDTATRSGITHWFVDFGRVWVLCGLFGRLFHSGWLAPGLSRSPGSGWPSPSPNLPTCVVCRSLAVAWHTSVKCGQPYEQAPRPTPWRTPMPAWMAEGLQA